MTRSAEKLKYQAITRKIHKGGQMKYASRLKKQLEK